MGFPMVFPWFTEAPLAAGPGPVLPGRCVLRPAGHPFAALQIPRRSAVPRAAVGATGDPQLSGESLGFQ